MTPIKKDGAVRKKIMSPPSSCVKRSLGTGIIERSPLKSNSAIPYIDNVHNDRDNHNVVRLRQNNNPSTTSVSSSSSSISVFDTTTDLSYHDRLEQEKSESILNSLTQDEQSSIPDKFMPLRHYRAEKGDSSKAVDAIKLTLAWRKEFEVDRIIRALEDGDDDNTNGTNHVMKSATHSHSDMRSNDEKSVMTTDFATILRKENETGKIYVRGHDKDGRAMMYMRPGNENTMHENNNMRHLVFQIEKAVRCSQKNGFGKICLVIDYEGFKMSKTPPISTTKRTLEILQRHYCERMYRMYICNPPFVFRSFYALIKPFVDPVTKQKVCFCVGEEGLQQIVDDVGGKVLARRQLEKCCGGDGNVRTFNSTEYMRLPLAIAFDEDVVVRRPNLTLNPTTG
mmetsp:Transcript_42707/g.48518  ORF Transcript_42707/g.48518 Transcript_42707/m.48518 type:complete len:396 (-) Transcript_42707:17-1204(-)